MVFAYLPLLTSVLPSRHSIDLISNPNPNPHPHPHPNPNPNPNSIDLITKLGDEEGRAYHRGFVASRGRDATCATLSSWATASNFPAAWAEADVLALTQALRTLAVAWGEEFLEAVNPTLTWLEAVIGGGVPSMAGHCEKAPLQEVAVSQ